MQNKLFKKWMISLVLMSMALSGCMGRHKDAVDHSIVDMKSLGLNQNKPAILIFGALWCHPCRAEIETINLAHSDFSNQVQILGLLVEGEAKGSQSKPSDIEEFKTFDGESPTYPLSLDINWVYFDELRPPQGHALPTMVFIQPMGRVMGIVQRSLDYQTEMKPMIQNFLAGVSIPPDQPDQPDPDSLTMTIAQWAARPGNDSHSPVYINVHRAWVTGLARYTFTAREMPFVQGQITFFPDPKLKKDIPRKSRWEALRPDSICRMVITFNDDGTAASYFGQCVPRE